MPGGLSRGGPADLLLLRRQDLPELDLVLPEDRLAVAFHLVYLGVPRVIIPGAAAGLRDGRARGLLRDGLVCGLLHPGFSRPPTASGERRAATWHRLAQGKGRLARNAVSR